MKRQTTFGSEQDVQRALEACRQIEGCVIEGVNLVRTARVPGEGVIFRAVYFRPPRIFACTYYGERWEDVPPKG